jgi:GNAT superfamily N-acetyltransferase
MPSYTFRIIDDADLPRIAELTNVVEREPVSADELRERMRAKPADLVAIRVAGLNEDGKIIGFAHVVRWSWMRPGHFWVRIVVDPLLRQQGAGSALYERAIEILRGHGAMHIESEARDDCPACLQFAEHRGFRVERHTYESRLNLAGFDEKDFAGIIEEVEAAGVRFFTLADVGNTPETQRNLFEINSRFAADNPANEGQSWPSFEEFSARVFQARWFRPNGQILAADGDRWIGLAAVGYYPGTRTAHNMFTGVDRAYRGRHIALALKLLAIRQARSYGATTIMTNNDSQNAPMLAINRKLGYQPEPGIYRLIRAM